MRLLQLIRYLSKISFCLTGKVWNFDLVADSFTLKFNKLIKGYKWSFMSTGGELNAVGCTQISNNANDSTGDPKKWARILETNW